jgi:hypothetical protein
LKKGLYIILLLFIKLSDFYSCSCRGIEDYYSFYKYNNYCFVGKAIAGNTAKDNGTYKIEVLDKLRSAFSGTITIEKEKYVSTCNAYFVVGEIYLLTLTVNKGLYYASKCSVYSRSRDLEFSEDTMLIKQFVKSNLKVDCSRFRGEIKNGKQVGLWEYKGLNGKVYEYGNFVNGKKNGVWQESANVNAIYKNGKWIKRTELIRDSAKITVVSTPKAYSMYDSTRRLVKKLTKHSYTFYGTNGKIIEKAKVRRGYFYGLWKVYNTDGSLKDQLKINGREVDPSAYDQFFYYFTPPDLTKWR